MLPHGPATAVATLAPSVPTPVLDGPFLVTTVNPGSNMAMAIASSHRCDDPKLAWFGYGGGGVAVGKDQTLCVRSGASEPRTNGFSGHDELCYRHKTMKAACVPALPPADLDLDTETDEALALLAKALAHPVRVQIVRILAKCESSICGDLVAQLPLAQSTVSQHLKVLKDAGLVRGTIDGPRVCYCIDPEGLRRLRLLVAGL